MDPSALPPESGSGSATPSLRGSSRYRILGELARGANGIVYEAHDLEMDRRVALKTLRHDEPGALARERFVREARISARLAHPGVVRVYETGEHEGRPFYTMEFIGGEPLRGPMPPAEACRILAGVARAVAHAHSRGVIHRDLKPSNILLRDGEPVLTDFGVARGPEDVRLTETGELLGTPAYMSPEQVRGDVKSAGAAADIHALGAILFELLTGRLPYDAETFVELSSRLLHDPAPDLVGFDPALAALVRRCLAKDPGARPSAAELARDLERWAPRPRRGRALPLSLLALFAASGLWAAAAPAPPGPDSRDGMVRIPAGDYALGDPRLGRRTVRLGGFWIDRDEAPSRAGGFSHADALAHCLRLGKRLPTEEEWEAATGGRLFPWGESARGARPACEGRKGPATGDESPFGCRSLAGGLAEWTASPGRADPALRVVRGGHWQRPIEGCTSWARDELPVSRRLPTLGFRCARTGGY